MTERSIQNFKWQVVWQKMTSDEEEQVIDFWVHLGILSKLEATKRAKQVVIIIKNENDQVVGLSTAYYSQFEKLKAYVYAYRCLIKKESRVAGLETKLAQETKGVLQKEVQNFSINKPIGMLAVVQNNDVKSNWNKAIWSGLDLMYIGNSPTGDHYRISYFNNARIEH